MITKESNTDRKCCLYASDFHLEMILLPYIKERINKSKFLIITQNDLSDTIKILLNRVNINKQEEKKILNLNWKVTNPEYIQSLNNLLTDNIHIIINGDYNYIKEVNNMLKSVNLDNINIIDCFNINDRYLDIDNIKNNYKQCINTSKI